MSQVNVANRRWVPTGLFETSKVRTVHTTMPDVPSALNLIFKSRAWPQSSAQPAGTVAYTRPSAGQVIPRGSQVKIYVSSGGKTKIPSAGVVGETPDNAIATLTALGFSAVAAPQPSQSQLFQHSATIPEGRVIGTIPAVGSSATLTGAILLIISSGP